MLGKKDNKQSIFSFCSNNPELSKKLIRQAGCSCKEINLGFAINRGPRCRNCMTVANVYNDEFRELHNLK